MKNRSSSNSSHGSRSEANVSYELLEGRKLLAGEVCFLDYEFSDNTGAIRTLAEPVPVEERFEVLRDVVDVQQEDSFRRTSLDRDDLGFAHVKHQQFHNNVPIEGATYTVHVKDRNVVSVSGSFIEYGSVATEDSLGEENALSAALEFVDADL